MRNLSSRVASLTPPFRTSLRTRMRAADLEDVFLSALKLSKT